MPTYRPSKLALALEPHRKPEAMLIGYVRRHWLSRPEIVLCLQDINYILGTRLDVACGFAVGVVTLKLYGLIILFTRNCDVPLPT